MSFNNNNNNNNNNNKNSNISINCIILPAESHESTSSFCVVNPLKCNPCRQSAQRIQNLRHITQRVIHRRQYYLSEPRHAMLLTVATFIMTVAIVAANYDGATTTSAAFSTTTTSSSSRHRRCHPTSKSFAAFAFSSSKIMTSALFGISSSSKTALFRIPQLNSQPRPSTFSKRRRRRRMIRRRRSDDTNGSFYNSYNHNCNTAEATALYATSSHDDCIYNNGQQQLNASSICATLEGGEEDPPIASPSSTAAAAAAISHCIPERSNSNNNHNSNNEETNTLLGNSASEWENESMSIQEIKHVPLRIASIGTMIDEVSDAAAAAAAATIRNDNDDCVNDSSSNTTTSTSATTTTTISAKKSINHHDNIRCDCNNDDTANPIDSRLIQDEDLDDLFASLVAKVEKYNAEAVTTTISPDMVQDNNNNSNSSNTNSNNSSPPVIPLLQQAYHYARSAHQGQCRKSGEPYITHPLGVAQIVADMKLDLPCLLTALLHDTVEDTPVTLQDITNTFGKELSQLVDGVTKVGHLPFTSLEELQSENYRKLILAMSRDIRVVLVKLADRAHNMRTLRYMPFEKQRKIARETMDIYAPLAHRLGIHWLKTELEDNCFRYLYPEEYERLDGQVKGGDEERKEYERVVVEILERQMREAGLGGGASASLELVNGEKEDETLKATKTLSVTGRTKGLWSIYTKLKRQGIGFDDVHDVIGFRIIVDDVASCYLALGALHSNFKPVPGKIKDYIALPKPNGYRSLHTTIIGPFGKRVEVQIRTMDMHEVAESGIAAHFLYKEGGASKNKANDDSSRFAWLRELVNEVQTQSDPIEFVNSVKEDLFSKEVLVFSPTGDLYALARGSSVLDFAYKVHSELGNHCTGAKVNGKMVSLRHQLKNGDTVEILASNNQTPKREWLQFVRTSKAKNRIRAWVKRRQREHSIVVGKEMVHRGLKEYNPRGDDVAGKKEYQRKLNHVFATFKIQDEKHLWYALGYGQISLKNVMKEVFGASAIATRGSSHPVNKKEKDDELVLQTLLENMSQDVSSTSTNSAQFSTLPNPGSNGIVVGQERNMLLKFCKNCSPLNGEQIRGVVTKGKGIKVHRQGCKYLLEADEKRSVDVQWDADATHTALRPVQLQVLCEDSPGVLANMSRSITGSGFNIGNVNLRKLSNGRGLAKLEVMLKSVEDLESVMRRLRQEEGILNVTRR